MHVLDKNETFVGGIYQVGVDNIMHDLRMHTHSYMYIYRYADTYIEKYIIFIWELVYTT